MPWHTVLQGEYVAQIAHAYGFADQSVIFDHPDNQPLKDKKRDPHVLHPGDRLFVPDKDDKRVEIATGKLHKFKVKLPKIMLRVFVHDEDDQPFASKPFKVTIDGVEIEGQTDGDGKIELPIPLTAKGGKLLIEGHELPLRIGHLDPIEEVTGAQSRLANVGYDLGGEHGEIGPRTREALRRFQKANGLTESGDLDDATRGKLSEKHRS